MAESFKAYLIQFLFGIFCNVIFFSEGTQFGWASSSIPKLLKNDSSLSITKEESKWISNSYILGDVLGGVFSILILNNISRKLALYLSCLPVLVALFGICFANSALVFYIARFVGGVGRNMNLVAVPMYITEIASPEIRCALGTFTNVFMYVGIIGVTALTTYASMRASAIAGIVVTVIALILIYFIPESPYYLLIVARKDDAKKSLQILRQREDIDQELKDLETAVQSQTSDSGTLAQTFLRLFTVRSNLNAVGIVIVLRSLQMLTGISVVVMHAHTIFEQAHGYMSPEVSSLTYYAVLLGSCVFSTSIADKFPRRILMIASCFFAFVLLTLQGIYFYFAVLGHDLQFLAWLPVLILILYSLAYRVGLGTVCYIMVAELFPLNVKVTGIALGTVFFSFSSLIANVIFDYTEDTFGIYTPFWVFGGCALVGVFFSAFVLPETKDKTLDEIQQLMASGKRHKEKNVIC